ncbi:MAG: S8 family serine peptidase [bacterium]
MCWGGSLSCSPSSSIDEELIIKEILDNGTVIVMPAGNGINGTNCGNGSEPFYPFHPSYDERIIIVSSTDINDMHYYVDPYGVNKTHSHFPEVDVCAPGYEMMGATETNCIQGGWPYYGGQTGTSFSSPIVAGLVGLIKSINPNLSAAEVQHFIKSTTDPIVDEINYSGLLGTGRINAYAAVLEASDCTPIVISGNETWSTTRDVFCGITVESGRTLEITNTVKLSKNAKIIVKPGGKLILNGGKLTSLHNLPWQGIFVEGNRTLPQTFANQGAVILQNGAIIENAAHAIMLHADGESWWTNGGIVQATDATFKNNKRSVEFVSYANENASGDEINNISFFENCTFTIDDDCLFDYPLAHITAWSVKGFRVTDCSFTDNRTNLDYFDDINTRDGIYSVDASYFVLNSSFNNLHYGIHSTATESSKTLSARFSDFDSYRGIYCDGLDYANVSYNNFTVDPGYSFLIPSQDGSISSDSYGLYVESVK